MATSKQIDLGDFRSRITINQYALSTDDDTGLPIKTAAGTYDRSAYVEFVNVRNFFDTSTRQITSAIRVYLRWYPTEPTINYTATVTYNGVVYSIEAVQPVQINANRYIQIIAYTNAVDILQNKPQ